jgi:chromate reductase
MGTFIGEDDEMAVTIAAIAGSLRGRSHTKALLRSAAQDLPPDVRLAIWDGLGSVSPFNEDLEAGVGAAGVAELRELIAGADAILVATPEYNGSIPGQLKNALDWASRPRDAAVLAGKPTAAISASPSPHGGARALADLCKILTVAGADLIETRLAVAQVHIQFTPGGRIADPGLRDTITQLISDLAQHAAVSSTRLAA